MSTYTVQIGNSDDKLGFVKWNDFFLATKQRVHGFATQVHFVGHSLLFEPWQNACFVFEMNEGLVEAFKKELNFLCAEYQQDCIALTTGKTEFIS